MSAWSDADRWRALVDGSACPICLRGVPLDVIATLPGSWLTMPADGPMLGYVCLVSRVHATELHQLEDGAAQAFMRDAQRVGRSLCEATGAIKLNHEIHGNSLPHLHMHFFPRHPGDQFEGKPIDPRSASRNYSTAEFAEVRSLLLYGLGDSPEHAVGPGAA
jgi:diadenosine tetraphosphate (Ap4A) HIT family hydrolase